ncbi:hypothetical protein [Streptomyces sp. NPDC048269]|uniref:hypothetical protein n=1 Tax=Streptomyces sp. NPDC048269 TaxID=3155753 RepID=UPI0034361243
MAQVAWEPVATGPGWWQSAPGAEAVAAGQLAVGLGLWIVLPSWTDDYGQGGWGFGAVLMLPFLCVIALAVLLGLAFVHAMVFTRPALALADRYGRGVAAAAWLLALSAACALFPWACGVPYFAAWAGIAGFGAAPLLVAHRAIGKGRRPGSVVGVTGLVTAVLVYAAMAAGILLVEHGLVKGYEPPRLERAEYVGEWRGADGGVVRLKEGGGAVVEGVPAHGVRKGITYCTAAGTWSPRTANPDRGRRAGVDLVVRDCDDWHPTWEVGGSAAHPELFQLYGDPDDGDMWLLSRR